MRNSHRSQIALASASGACALVAVSALALAQTKPADVTCRKTETQAECHDRLKCKPDEDLEDCQRRLLKCTANETMEACVKRVSGQAPKDGNAVQRDDAGTRGGDRDTDDANRNARDRDTGDANRNARDRDTGDANRNARDRDTQNDGRERRDRGSRGRERRDRDDDTSPRRQRGANRGNGGRGGFGANKTFGLGLELGEPTGLNGKYFVSQSGALDFGVGYIYGHYYYGDGFHIYADYLWHPTSLVSASAFELPFYIGGGLRFWDFRYCDMRVCDYDGSAVGIRVPFGIAFDFNNVPLDIFIQLVPVLDFLSGDYYNRYGDRAHFGIDLSAGIRYWFK